MALFDVDWWVVNYFTWFLINNFEVYGKWKWKSEWIDILWKLSNNYMINIGELLLCLNINMWYEYVCCCHACVNYAMISHNVSMDIFCCVGGLIWCLCAFVMHHLWLAEQTVPCLISFEACWTIFSFIVVEIYLLDLLVFRCLFLKVLFMVLLCYGEACVTLYLLSCIELFN